jgi:adenine-specific DNA methylase
VQGNPGAADADLRKALLKFVADFANWDLAANRNYLEVSRALIRVSHGGEPPLVVDPFAGGGSIPLEALRLGCEAFASDLNPVACLILKVMLEDIPRRGSKLAEELRRIGAEVKKQAEGQLSEFYAKDPTDAATIAYLWARTVRCEAPHCGAEIPLVRSFWLCKKASRKRALRYRIERSKGKMPHVAFEIFEPKTDKEVPVGTVTRAKAKCLCCGTVLGPERVRTQLVGQRGGADVVFDSKGQRIGGARLLTVVTLRCSDPGRHYRVPNQHDYEGARKAQARVAKMLADWERSGGSGPCPIPNEPTPVGGGSGAGRAFSVHRYGMVQWGDLFTARQKVAFSSIANIARALAPDTAVKELVALCISRAAARNSSLCLWLSQGDQETVWTTFGRNALPIVWDFAEAAPLSQSTGSLDDSFEVTSEAIAGYPNQMRETGQVEVADAAESYPLHDEAADLWFTDPPYYDAIPYAELSDFFFVWLKRVLPGHSLLRDVYNPTNPLTPKSREVVQDETKRNNGRLKDRAWFEETLSRAFSEGRRLLADQGIGAVVFAHKTTEGWEALLSGAIRGGWTITGSWPIATERKGRPRAHQSAALATSVHLICRPRSEVADVGDWAKVLRELPKRVAEWMERLQGEGVRGADLVFACIGPALEIFSRYRKVETADGRDVPLAEYLEKVWEVVGRTALENVLGTAEARARNGVAGALEEDARLTALFLWTLQATNGAEADKTITNDEQEEGEFVDEELDEESTPVAKSKGFVLVFDVVRRFAQPLGIELRKWDGRIIEMKKGVVRLLPVAERAEQLFGADGAQSVASRIEEFAAVGASPQLTLFPNETAAVPTIRGRSARRRGNQTVRVPDERLGASREATTLDRVHASMLLQAGGRTNALRALVKAEQERGPDFLRLANALSALYPKASEDAHSG